MAPEPEVLKRKRSRPSDWWAVNPDSPAKEPQPRKEPQPESRPSPNKRGSNLQDAPAAGNRGKKLKEKVRNNAEEDGNGNAEDELVLEKPRRRTRNSATEGELKAVSEPSTISQDVRRRGVKTSKAQVEDKSAEGEVQAIPKKRGRRKVQVEEEIESAEETPKDPARNQEELPREQIALKKRRRPISQVEDIETQEEPVGESKSLRRGRASNAELDVQAHVEEPVREKASKKRGRKSDTEIVLPRGVTQLQANENERGKRRTRRSDVESQEVELPGLMDVQDRGRERTRQLGRDMVAPEFPASASTEQERGRRLTRLSDVGVASLRPDYREKARKHLPRSNTERPEPAAPAAAKDAQDRGRKRTRLLDAELEGVPRPDYREKKKRTRQSDVELEKPNEIADLSPKENDGGKGRKTVSRRDTNMEVEAASSKFSKARNGSKNLVKPSKKSGVMAVSSDPSQNQAKKSKHPPQIVPSKRQSKHVESLEKERAKRRRLSKAAEPVQDQDDTPEVEAAPAYQHLAAVTRKVSRETIESKWEPLPPPCVERISQMLQDVQRPVVAHLTNDQKRTQASTALQMVSRRLVSKISKGLPFPQGTRNHQEDDFDFEKILDHNRALEAHLTPALHANELLESDLRKEMARLESEQAYLAGVETNTKREAAFRSQTTKLHPLLQLDDSTPMANGVREDIGLDPDLNSQPLNLNIQNDENLQALVQDLNDHVGSIQGNIGQVQGITEAMAKSKATVQAALFGRVDTAQYEGVVLGPDPE